MKKDEKGITVNKDDDISEWYGQVVIKSGLADYSPVRGTMIIKPYGYALWQNIMDYFNSVLKKMKVENAYFPLFIPEKFFRREAEHAKGFAPEVAWIEKKDDGERLGIRPTSETIIYDSFSKWIRSHRDLPMRINQWCNIVRWEVKDVKLFLRSREFLWQEGHCVYETEDECDKETLIVLKEYERLCEGVLSVPVIKGEKSEKEKFAGAKYTTTVEAFMPDGKFLQCGTSHNLGTGFAKAFGIKYVGENEKDLIPWQNSWGFSTRLIGAIVMTHGDDKGLVLPPRIAPNKIAIVPIIFEKTKKEVIEEARKLEKELSKFNPICDTRDEYSAGWKFSQYELKGVPIRIEIGPKDIEKHQIVAVRRDTFEKIIIKRKEIKEKLDELMDDIQNQIYDKAHEFLKKQIIETEDYSELKKSVANKKIVFAPFCGELDCEDVIKEETKGANSRCFPFQQKEIDKKCVQCGKQVNRYAYFGKNY